MVFTFAYTVSLRILYLSTQLSLKDSFFHCLSSCSPAFGLLRSSYFWHSKWMLCPWGPWKQYTIPFQPRKNKCFGDSSKEEGEFTKQEGEGLTASLVSLGRRKLAHDRREGSFCLSGQLAWVPHVELSVSTSSIEEVMRIQVGWWWFD